MTDVALQPLERRSRPNGWWGLAVFIATEATLFGTLVGTYLYLRFRTVHWPPPGIDAPGATVPLVMAGVLLATTVPMAVASGAAQRGRAGAAWLGIFAALVVQSGYFAFEIHSFQDDLQKFQPTDNAYGSIYYTLLGADHAHVALGLLFSVFMLARLTTGLTRYRAVGVQTLALYWYFVDVLTLVVVGTILSASV